jgi:hypothetical protein
MPSSHTTGTRQLNFRACFFCGKDIHDQASAEHVFSDAFLAFLQLKLDKIQSSLTRPTTYSKLKIPAHRRCNHEQGSRFERQILSLLNTLDSNVDALTALNGCTQDPLHLALRQAFSMWLGKLYFGLLYWEAGLKHHNRPEYQAYLHSLLEDDLFDYLRRCFTEELAFAVPSSLFYFHLPKVVAPPFRFDFETGLPLGLIYVRTGRHLFITALADGHLTAEWFNQSHVAAQQAHIEEHEDPVAYLDAVAHIWAVREWLPVAPNLEYLDSSIVDRSRENLAERPPIDGDAVNERATELFSQLCAKWKPRPHADEGSFERPQ